MDNDNNIMLTGPGSGSRRLARARLGCLRKLYMMAGSLSGFKSTMLSTHLKARKFNSFVPTK